VKGKEGTGRERKVIEGKGRELMKERKKKGMEKLRKGKEGKLTERNRKKGKGGGKEEKGIERNGNKWKKGWKMKGEEYLSNTSPIRIIPLKFMSSRKYWRYEKLFYVIALHWKWSRHQRQ
jgi:hypothetical protein